MKHPELLTADQDTIVILSCSSPFPIYFAGLNRVPMILWIELEVVVSSAVQYLLMS